MSRETSEIIPLFEQLNAVHKQDYLRLLNLVKETLSNKGVSFGIEYAIQAIQEEQGDRPYSDAVVAAVKETLADYVPETQKIKKEKKPSQLINLFIKAREAWENHFQAPIADASLVQYAEKADWARGIRGIPSWVNGHPAILGANNEVPDIEKRNLLISFGEYLLSDAEFRRLRTKNKSGQTARVELLIQAFEKQLSVDISQYKHGLDAVIGRVLSRISN